MFKKFIDKRLESSSIIKKLYHKYSEEKKPVLIIGDGISSMYIQEILHKYQFIITCNRSMLNQNIKNCSPLYWVTMNPEFLSETIKEDAEIWEFIRENLKNCKNTIPIMHSANRVLNFGKWKSINPIFFSPYHQFNLSSGEIYNHFKGAFEACLGIALLNGFKEIHIVGFDAFLLAPKNNLRWYSKSSNPDAFDLKSSEHKLISLEKASRNSKISVFSYRHYKLKYDFLNEIKINSKNVYIPERDRSKYMNYSQLKFWEEFENSKYPDGYTGEKFF